MEVMAVRIAEVLERIAGTLEKTEAEAARIRRALEARVIVRKAG